MTITTPAIFTCPSSSGFYPVPESPCSNLYYTCISGVPYMSVSFFPYKRTKINYWDLKHKCVLLYLSLELTIFLIVTLF